MGRLTALLGCLLALPAVAQATTYVLMSDADLADRAAAIVRGRIATSAPTADGAAVAYRVIVERTLKGLVAGDVTVRIPGAPDAVDGGAALQVWGAPVFARGDRVILFLVPNADGSYHVLHLLLGAFREVVDGTGQRLAVRDLGDAREVAGRSRAARDDRTGLRDANRFAQWLSARDGRPADYFLAASAASRGQRRVREFFGTLRWFEFDLTSSARVIRWVSHRLGQPGVAGGGHREFKAALRAWTKHDGSTVAYDYDGRSDADAGFDAFDGVNAILFDAPIGDPFDCAAGGVLAIGGPWFIPRGRARFRGKRFIRILGADIVVNEGIACFFDTSPDPRRAAEELFGHELGHTLGLAHSCGDLATGECDTADRDDALMRAFVHDDGRGAALGVHDRAAICRLYARPDLTVAECAAR